MNSVITSKGQGMTSDRTRSRMVERLREEGIKNESVLSALELIPRHMFVDEALNTRSYEMVSLPIGYGQTISHPFIVARLCEHVLSKNTLCRVLEIGSGCGYQAAILSQLANQVFSIERNLSLLNSARIRLKKLGFRNVLLRHGDGYHGYEANSPYDAIVVTAAAEFVPNALINQLKSGGILVMPIGRGNQQLVKIMKTETGIEKKFFEKVKFVPMLSGLS